MNSVKIIQITCLSLSIILSPLDLAFPSLVDTNRIATPNGLVPAKNLKKGDRVLSYNFDAKTPEKFISEVAVTKIDKHFADSVFGISLAGDRYINASPQQMVFTAKQEIDEAGNIHFIVDLVQAQYLTPGQMLVDWNLDLIPITEINKITLYEEKRVYKSYCLGLIKKGRTVVTKFEPVDMYSFELEPPNIFLTPAGKDGLKLENDPDLPLILMHNGFPALALGASFAFGSTPASITFAEATLTTGGLTATLGPAGLAIGVTAGVGYFLYNLFSKNKNKLYLEKSDKNNSDHQINPKSPNKNKDAPKKEQAEKEWDNDKIKIIVDSNGNAIPLKPREKIEGSPDGTMWQVKDVNGKPTGDRYDGKGHPKQSDSKAQGPHAHRIDSNGKPVLDETGNPHLPINISSK